MATPVRDETRDVTDDNISTQVQSKVKLREFSMDTSIEIDQKDLEILRPLIQKPITKKDEIVNNHTQEDEFLVTNKFMEVIEKNDKVQNKIHTLETIDSEEDQHTLHERNDSSGTYYLFSTKSVKHKKYYPKDCILNYKLKDKENIPTFLNKFDQLLRRHGFDNIFSNEIKTIDPRI